MCLFCSKEHVYNTNEEVNDSKTQPYSQDGFMEQLSLLIRSSDAVHWQCKHSIILRLYLLLSDLIMIKPMKKTKM